MSDDYRYCPKCAQELQPLSDQERLRLFCPACGWVHYRNPTAGVAVILLRMPAADARAEILLGERRDGGWCIPCGHVEWDETIQQAARREIAEETGLQVKLGSVFAVHSNFHDPRQHTIGVWYRGQVISGSLKAGGDLLQAAYFPLDDLPELKFPTDRLVVEQLRSALKQV